MLFEISYPDEKIAKEALTRAIHKLPIKARIVSQRGAVLMAVGTSPGELRELTEEELTSRLRESKEELFNLRFQMATGQLANNRRLRVVRRRDCARVHRAARTRVGSGFRTRW